MNRLLNILCLFALAPLVAPATANDGVLSAAPQVQTRCGWFSNPSPNNASLTDRDGEWSIAIQGEFEARGDWPEFKKSAWISSGNASYGKGCTCMRVVVDKQAHKIVSIESSSTKPLSACRRDKSLKAAKRNDG